MYLPKQESTMVSFYTIKGFTYERDNQYELIGEYLKVAIVLHC